MGLQAMETFGAYKIIRSGPANWIDYGIGVPRGQSAFVESRR